MPRKSTSPSDKPVAPSKTNEYRRTHEYQNVPIRQRLLFAKEYVRTGNATAAWKAAFPQSRAEYNSQRASAWKMLNAPKTQDIIERLREKSFARYRSTLEEIVAENLNIVRFDPARIFEDGKLKAWEDIDPADRRCISEVKVDESYDPDGNLKRTITVKRQDRGPALDRLAKMVGAYERDNAQKAAAAQAAMAQKDSLQIAQRVAFLLQRGIREAGAHRAPITIEQKTS